jgi:multiple sugar transport system substrate-binding protein
MTKGLRKSLHRRHLVQRAATLTAASIAWQTTTQAKASTTLSVGTPLRLAQSDTLEFLFLGPTQDVTDILKNEIIPAFQDAEGVKINLQTTDWGSAFQKITTAAAAGTAPDIMLIGGIWTAPLAAKGVLFDVSEYVASWSDAEQYPDGVWADCRFEGGTYGIPMNLDSRTLVFRKDFFEEAGLDPASPPETWDDYKQAAQKLAVADGNNIKRQGADWGINTSIGLQQSFAQAYFQAGGQYYKEDGSGNFSSPEGVEALQWVVSFFEEGLSSTNIIAQSNAPQPLVAGTGAMTYGNAGILQNAQTTAADIVPLLAAGPPLRKNADSERITSAWINKFAMSANTKNPDAAWKFLTHLSNKDNTERQLQAMGLLPARSDLFDAPYLEGVDRAFFDASEFIVPQPPHPEMLQIAQIINTELERAVRGENEPEKTLESIDQQINKLVGR